MKQLTHLLAIAALVVGALSAKDDPFCGKWKLDKNASKVTGRQMKIADLGNKKLKFTMSTDTDTVTMDGSDQPVHEGRTMALTSESPTSFKMDIKMNGKVLSSMTHTLSDNGNTQTVKGTEYKPDGTKSDFETVLKRVGAGSGWTGTWESIKVDYNSPDDFEISPNGSNGLTFHSDAYKVHQSMKFDGKEYPEEGPTVPPGLLTSGKRNSERSFALTDKIKGKVVSHSTFEVSSDGKTLTVTANDTGQPNTATYVYNKM